MNYDEIYDMLKNIIPTMETYEKKDFICDKIKVKSYYLGSYMFLDPCGRYHAIISPNGIDELRDNLSNLDGMSVCERFWGNLEKAANALNGYITEGEGDPTDIFFEIPLED